MGLPTNLPKATRPPADDDTSSTLYYVKVLVIGLLSAVWIGREFLCGGQFAAPVGRGHDAWGEIRRLVTGKRRTVLQVSMGLFFPWVWR